MLIHGLVKRPLIFRFEDLLRYPTETRILFLECSGDRGALGAEKPEQVSAGALHGLLSGTEWTGIRLSPLLDEAQVSSDGRWAKLAVISALGRGTFQISRRFQGDAPD